MAGKAFESGRGAELECLAATATGQPAAVLSAALHAHTWADANSVAVLCKHRSDITCHKARLWEIRRSLISHRWSGRVALGARPELTKCGNSSLCVGGQHSKPVHRSAAESGGNGADICCQSCSPMGPVAALRPSAATSSIARGQSRQAA